MPNNDITRFSFMLQQEIRNATQEGDICTAELRARYEAEMAADARFRACVKKFIEPTMFRIDQALA